MQNIKTVVDSVTAQPWVVRLVSPGMSYGLNNALTAEEPLVEFYDLRYPHTQWGQFVSRYYLETLLRRNPSSGFCLDGGVPSWSITEGAFQEIFSWLRAQEVTAWLKADPLTLIAYLTKMAKAGLRQSVRAIDAETFEQHKQLIAWAAEDAASGAPGLLGNSDSPPDVDSPLKAYRTCASYLADARIAPELITWYLTHLAMLEDAAS